MAFCPNCGTQVAGARFCPNCGSDTGAPGPSTASAGFAPQPMAVTAPGLTDNVASALCYLGWFITGIIFLVLSPYNRNRTVRFHAWQSIFTFVAIIIVHAILAIVLFDMMHLWIVGGSLISLFDLTVFVLWIYLMYSAYNGRTVSLPVVGDLAAKQA